MGVTEDNLDARTHVVFTWDGTGPTSDVQSLHRAANHAFDMPAASGTTVEVRSGLSRTGTMKAVRAGLTLTVVADAINPITDSTEAMSLAALTYCELELDNTPADGFQVKVGLRRVSSDS